MQTKRAIRTVYLGALGLSVVGSVLAEQADSIDQAEVNPAVPASEAISIVGKRVGNAAGDDLGVVTNVLIDPSSGQITALVVGIGGVFGYGAYRFVVPWQRVNFAQDQAQVLLSVPRDEVGSEFPAYKPRLNPTPKQQGNEYRPGAGSAEPNL